ncbi:hypothetical protein COX84_01225 [Candidatus Micrarchaeota archaeon CG_4_10_14_0_2_um_filter_49_7]|nr:MAG: hypothetical protein COV93_00095 [Candidatus Woesearchaeota archaeon CG11_big_fil_rev_8_21_14_0_20_43_8]PIZ99247.1 MAG: hypothetical protein COX84_01225 [Candidatus Micrarchaeota archaeon CG_4_10_14_0_2_um_filter_49_7]
MIDLLKGIIFDCDGTIIPTLERQESWFRFYSKRNNQPWRFNCFDDFKEFYNDRVSRPGNVQNVYDELSLPCDMSDKSHPVWPAYEQFNSENPLELYPGMRQALDDIMALSSGLVLGLNTSNSMRSIKGSLVEGGIISYFKHIITSDTLREKSPDGDCEPLKKPNTFSIELMLGVLGTEPEETLHVGDTIADLRASHGVHGNRSLLTVGACYGYEGSEILSKGYGGLRFDELVDDASGLVAVVKKFL